MISLAFKEQERWEHGSFIPGRERRQSGSTLLVWGRSPMLVLHTDCILILDLQGLFHYELSEP